MENVFRRTNINRNTDGSYEAQVTYRVTASVNPTKHFDTLEQAQAWIKNNKEPDWTRVTFPKLSYNTYCKFE